MLLLTRSRFSQASSLGANKVKEPLPSIFSLIPDLSVYCWVVSALNSARVPYTWSMGATVGNIEKLRMLCAHWRRNQTVLMLHKTCCERTSTCRTSSHAFELHIPRTALIKDFTLPANKQKKRNMPLDFLSQKICWYFHLFDCLFV